jgi:hypothetical protein
MNINLDGLQDSKELLMILRQDHRDLDLKITELVNSGCPAQFEISRLKKRKLVLKDQIARLHSKLIPDLLA